MIGVKHIGNLFMELNDKCDIRQSNFLFQFVYTNLPLLSKLLPILIKVVTESIFFNIEQNLYKYLISTKLLIRA